MLFTIIKRLIERGQVDGLQEKVDVFYAVGRITGEQYDKLYIAMGLKEPETVE